MFETAGTWQALPIAPQRKRFEIYVLRRSNERVFTSTRVELLAKRLQSASFTH